MFGADPVLPDGAVLLHVGPHKTGTTNIQGALYEARPRLRDLGVIYPGRARQHQQAALYLTATKGLHGDRAPIAEDWDKVIREVATARTKRVIVSSEFFDECTDEVAQTVANGLGADRTHVVITLRPVAKIMPSAWQQYVRNGMRTSYDEWLDGMLRKAPYDSPTPSFWRRHRHDVLVERWVKTVGPDRVLVIVLDETDQDGLMRTFEHVLAVPEGTLVPEVGWDNRSLTAAETELVRAINVDFHERKWAPSIYNNVFRLGLIAQMQRRPIGPDERGIITPRWAIERANEIAAEAAARIEASGAHIIGDLSSLSAVSAKEGEAAQQLPMQAAKEAVVGAIIGSGVVSREPPIPLTSAVLNPKRRGGKKARGRTIEEYGTRELATILRDRLLTRYRPVRRR